MTHWTVTYRNKQHSSSECPYLCPTHVYRVFELCGHPESGTEKCGEKQCPIRGESLITKVSSAGGAAC
jgi:hypothetical protein